MKRVFVSLVVALCAFGVAPGRAAAQCHETCTMIYSPDGKIIGRGCVYDFDSLTSCLATATMCITGDCGSALVVDANGTLLAEAEICRDKVTLRSLTPARVTKVAAKAAHTSKLGHVSPRLRASE